MPILGLEPSSKPIHPPHFDIEKVIRPNILALHPYRCARDDYQEGILLDANENAFGHFIMDRVKTKMVMRMKNFQRNYGPHSSLTFIDTLTHRYGMYSVCAQVNDVGIVKVPLELSGEKGEGGQEGRFSVRIDAVSKFKFDGDIRLVICGCVCR